MASLGDQLKKIEVATVPMPADKAQDLERLNRISAGEAKSEFLKCCGSQNWAKQISAARSFKSPDDMLAKAEQIWWSLDPADWLEAFHSHPRIGEKKAAAETSAQSRQWSAAEQAGINRANESTLAELADLNKEYEEKFGYIFIVCASGKSPEEMLELLRARLQNGPDEEIRVAAAEQAKITELRLKKLISGQ